MATSGQQEPGPMVRGPQAAGPGKTGNGPPGATAAINRPPPRRLALLGLPADVAEPVTLLAEILGWQVLPLPPGPAMPPPAHACLAMLPACAASGHPPLTVWSADRLLNEHISRAGLSIMDQPLCITKVEQMLEALVCVP